MRRIVAFALACACCASVQAAAPYADADAPETGAAAEAAVAALGAAASRSIVPTVRDVPALQHGVGAGSRAITASVQDVRRALSDLKGTETELEVRIELPADVLFDVDRDAIRPDAASALANLATVIRGYEGPVRLVGHTDADGSDAHNLTLSQRRAESVRRWLVERESLPAARFTTEGLGESTPRVPNDSAANKQLNRRVEVIVRKRAG